MNSLKNEDFCIVLSVISLPLSVLSLPVLSVLPVLSGGTTSQREFLAEEAKKTNLMMPRVLIMIIKIIMVIVAKTMSMMRC